MIDSEKSWLQSITRPQRILVVEDDDSVAEVLARKLSRFNVSLQTARDGVEAISLFDEGNPRAVILDLGLPKVDGFEVFRHIRSKSRILPVVIVTGAHFDSGLINRVYSIGYASFLIKPLYISEEFIEAIFSPFSLQPISE